MNDWPDSHQFWKSRRVIVTGGGGFVGSFLVEKLRDRGAADVIVPRSKDYDLRDISAIRRLLDDVRDSWVQALTAKAIALTKTDPPVLG